MLPKSVDRIEAVREPREKHEFLMSFTIYGGAFRQVVVKAETEDDAWKALRSYLHKEVFDRVMKNLKIESIQRLDQMDGLLEELFKDGR